MSVTVTRLTPCFAARIDGVDIGRPVAEPAWSGIRAAFDEHSVLVFRGPRLDDEAQIAFSRRFGALEVTRSSLLSARIIPPEGGATEFASARGAYPSLPEALKRRVERATVVHDFSWSRDQVRPGFFTDRERAEYPPVRHPLVRANPVNGRQALFLGAHASHVEGMPVEEGRARAAPGDAVRHHALRAADAAHDGLRRAGVGTDRVRGGDARRPPRRPGGAGERR
jgi:alpha-ketoglutarate-dependent 2,4-dichlorophenoxyacetate dioxygenase